MGPMITDPGPQMQPEDPQAATESTPMILNESRIVA